MICEICALKSCKYEFYDISSQTVVIKPLKTVKEA